MRNKLLAISLCVFLSGCSFSVLEQQATTLATNTINNNPSTVTAGFYNGLVAVGKLNSTDAKLTATALGAAAANCALSFSGQTLPLGSDAQLILANLGKNLPGNAAGVVTLITGAVQTFVQIPSGQTAVSPATATVIVNLCNEIGQACAQYLNSLPQPAPAAPAVVVPTVRS